MPKERISINVKDSNSRILKIAPQIVCKQRPHKPYPSPQKVNKSISPFAMGNLKKNQNEIENISEEFSKNLKLSFSPKQCSQVNFLLPTNIINNDFDGFDGKETIEKCPCPSPSSSEERDSYQYFETKFILQEALKRIINDK